MRQFALHYYARTITLIQQAVNVNKCTFLLLQMRLKAEVLKHLRPEQCRPAINLIDFQPVKNQSVLDIGFPL